jgi:hypothetical protein
MPQNLNEELRFSYNSSYTKTQLIFLFIWSSMGFIMILFSPRFFISYIVPVLGFSLFIYLMKAFKGFYLTIRGHQLSYGILYKTVIDLRTARRIKNFGEDYIIKTDHKNYTLRSNFLREDERPLLHEFFNRYTKAEEIIFP